MFKTLADKQHSELMASSRQFDLTTGDAIVFARIASGRIEWHLPGGEITKNRNRAQYVVKEMARLMRVKRVK